MLVCCSKWWFHAFEIESNWFDLISIEKSMDQTNQHKCTTLIHRTGQDRQSNYNKLAIIAVVHRICADDMKKILAAFSIHLCASNQFVIIIFAQQHLPFDHYYGLTNDTETIFRTGISMLSSISRWWWHSDNKVCSENERVNYFINFLVTSLHRSRVVTEK